MHQGVRGESDRKNVPVCVWARVPDREKIPRGRVLNYAVLLSLALSTTDTLRYDSLTVLLSTSKSSPSRPPRTSQRQISQQMLVYKCPSNVRMSILRGAARWLRVDINGLMNVFLKLLSGCTR